MEKQCKYNQIKNLCNDFYSEMENFVTQIFSNLEINHNEYFCDLKNYLFGNSKQIRSCLIFLFANNLGYKPNDMDIIKLATAVEIIHNATLIHDDIIDNSPIRRGNISLHEKYNNKLGVISGDFLLSIAFNLLLDLPQSVMKNFAICLNSLCFGEINQYFSIKTTPTVEEYLKKSEQKTASLFIAALKSLMEIKNSELSIAAEKFALHFGRAFQINDDLKNIISTDKNKPILNDIEQGIYTIPVIYAFGELQDLSLTPENEIIEKTTNKSAINKTKKILDIELNTAISCLKNFPENDYKYSIIELCELLNVNFC